MRAEAMAAYTRSVVEALVAALKRQAEQIADLREAPTIVALSGTQEAQPGPESAPGSAGAPASFWRSWWPWLVLLIITLALAGALVFVPR